MKRLALLLGSLLVVTAAASAKEVVPAPVVVEEAPVQIIEKEVIVYRDKEEGFRPNGFVDVNYRYYGKTEDTMNLWNTNDRTSRTEVKTKINMTENQALEARVRDYNSLNSEKAVDKTQTRLRYWYNHGLVGDSKINFDSRVEYINAKGEQNVEYQAQFDFAEYLFNNDFVQTDYFKVSPKYGYTWGDKNDSSYTNTVGVDVTSYYSLPAGFSVEANLYLSQKFYGQDQENVLGDKYNDNFLAYAELYLYNTTNLYTNGNYALDFVLESGIDGAEWSQEKIYGSSSHSSYSLYAYPALRVSYQATDFINVYALAGAEFRNFLWEEQSTSSAQDWRWQPTATVGFTTTF